jgi:predicted nuclease of predicted toxin-antitoxin system
LIKFLIDECLTPELASVSRARWIEADHVARVGKSSAADWQVVGFALAGDYVLVTNNAKDFKRLYRKVDVHPGLVIILPQGRAVNQVTLFEKVLDHLEENPDIVNALVEIETDGRITVSRWSANDP